MLQISDWLKQAENDLRAAGVDAPRTDALVLLERVLNRDRAWILSHGDEKIASQELSTLSPLLKKRQNREPLAYIVGTKEFYGLTLSVTPDVLIPRPETEALVEHCIKNAPKNGTLLDVGTGSGAIAIAVKLRRPDLTVVASDVSQKALNVAMSNSGQQGTNLNFVHSNLLNYITEKYDVIAANLPYVPTQLSLEPELSIEPKLALYAGPDGLDCYRKFLDEAPGTLTSQGWIIIEHLPEQRSAIAQLAKPKLTLQKVSSHVSALSQVRF